MASAVAQYKTVYGERATLANLEHLFMVLNNKNDKQIVFRDFAVHIENVGLPFDSKQQRKIYDLISRSVKKGRSITKASWVKGVEIAAQHPNVRATYAALLSGKQYDPQPGRQEIDLDEIRIKLQDLKAPWMYRVDCMQSLCRQLCTSSLSVAQFHELFRGYHISLTRQAKDRRSNVSRVACEAFSKIIFFWKNEFLKYAYTTIEYLYELVRQKIAIVHQSGYKTLVVLLENCGDHKHFKIMDILGREGTTSKFENLKKDCFDLLLLYLKQQNSELKSKKEFWTKILDYTKKGVNDNADVRNAALRLLAQIQWEKPEITKDIIKNMGVHLRKRYDTQYRLLDGKPGGISLDNDIKYDDDDDWGEIQKINTKRPKSARSDKKNFGFSATPTPQTQRSSRRNRAKTNTKVPKTPPPPRTRSRGRTSGGGRPSNVSFPKAKSGEFLNGFGQTINEEDMQFAFEFVDFNKDRKITMDEFEVCCRRLNVANKQTSELFAILDIGNKKYVQLSQFRIAIAQRDGGLMDFWERLLSGKHLECAPLTNDLDFDEANKILNNLKKSEDDRLCAMYSVTRKICGLKKYDNDKTLEKQFKKSMGGFVNQLKDRNNCIIREMCICFSKIFMAKKALYKPFYVRTFENLQETIKLSDTKVTTSAKQAGMCFIKFCPDRTACTLMKYIRDGCCDKHNVNLRSASFEFVNYYLYKLIKSFDDKKTIFWDYLEASIKSGLNDSDPTVRDLTYAALAKTEMVNRKLADKYSSTLKKTRFEKYESIKKDEMRHIQSGKTFKTKPSRRRIKSYTPQATGSNNNFSYNKANPNMGLAGIGSPKPRRNPRSPRTPSSPQNGGKRYSANTFAKATKLLQKEKDKSYKVYKRPKNDTSDTEEREKKKKDKFAAQKLRLEKRKSLNEDKEKQKAAEKERKEREKAEKLKKQKELKRIASASKGLVTAKKLELQRLEQEEKDTLKRLERIRLEKGKVQKHEKERKEREAREKEQLEFERNEKERLEKWRRDKLEKLEKDRIENERKQKIEKERLQKLQREQREIQKQKQNVEQERRQNADRARIKRQNDIRMQQQQKQQREKAEQEQIERQRAEQERIQRQKAEQERIQRQKAEQERIQRQKADEDRINRQKAEEQRIQRQKAQAAQQQQQQPQQYQNSSSNDDDYGYPNVHLAATAYFQEKGVHCHNPTHLVLFAKKKGISKISFAKVSRYFKAKK